jgi:electron transfer flavoprotein alpha subunit
MTRVRRDPRTRLERRPVSSTRTRAVLQPAAQDRATRPVSPQGETPSPPDKPSVVAVLDAPHGNISDADRVLLGKAQRLAQRADGGVLVPAWKDADGTALAGAGADRVLRIVSPADSCEREAMARALVEIDHSFEPAYLVFHDAIGRSGDVGRRLAAAKNDATRSRFVFVRGADGCAAEPRAGTDIEPIAIDRTAIRYTGMLAPDRLDLELTDAPFIVAGGMGVRDWQTFRSVACALNATIGATRAVCDAGLLTRDRQIGASGQIVSPVCYVALGISGAPQHIQGLRSCEYVIAVNTDLHAAMLKRADLAVVADVQQVMPALLQVLGEPQ